MGERSKEICEDNTASETEKFLWETLTPKGLRNTALTLYQELSCFKV